MVRDHLRLLEGESSVQLESISNERFVISDLLTLCAIRGLNQPTNTTKTAFYSVHLI